MSIQSSAGSRWMSVTLWAAAAYNGIWGFTVALAPHWTLRALGAPIPESQVLWPDLWACIGMIVGVYGVGYAIAARDPLRHWPIVLVGLLGKALGPIGFVDAALGGRLPWSFGWTVITNDLIWWVPFGVILWHAARANMGGQTPEGKALSVQEALARARVSDGSSLAELSRGGPALVVFLRHAGCTFCREALADIAARRARIESEGVRIVLVHMGDDASAREFFAKYGLDDVARVSDPGRELYRAFDLRRGTLRQLFGLRVWWRGFVAGVLGGHGAGALAGDGFQMPGVFLIRNERIERAFRHVSAGDRPEYESMACGVPTGA